MEIRTSDIKVIIAEDHLLFTEGVEQILLSLPGFTVVKTVENGKLLMQVLNNIVADLLLLDINMPNMNGLDAARAVRLRLPAIKIVFLSMYHDVRTITEAKALGANGYVFKTSTAPELKFALQQVMSGINVFPSSEMVTQTILSPREMEVAGLVETGLTTKEIADRLGLSELTIETHRKNIFKKLDVKNMAEMIGRLNDLRK